jgi:hypothetical protein
MEVKASIKAEGLLVRIHGRRKPYRKNWGYETCDLWTKNKLYRPEKR